MKFHSRWILLTTFIMVVLISLNLNAYFNWRRMNATNLQPSSACSEPFNIQTDNKLELNSLSNFVSNVQDFVLSSEHVNMTGVYRRNRGFLSIGVPSIHRINDQDYILQTLDSLCQHVLDEEKPEVVVLVFLVDEDPDYNEQSLRIISQKYHTHLASGFLQIIQLSSSYYPSFLGLKRNFYDAPERIKWRAKQAADFAAMFSYARNLSEYYVQIEDDVECSHGFVAAIRRFITERNARNYRWKILEFSELGFIGKLFHYSDLERVSRFISMFYAEQPVDWLLKYYRFSVGQQSVILRKPTLFQHFGVKSSFDISRDNLLRDRYFDPGLGKWSNADYPAARVLSTMHYHDTYSPDMFYYSSESYFWAVNPKAGDTVHLLFETPLRNVSAILVETGNNANSNDILHDGTLSAAGHVLHIDYKTGQVECDGLQQLAVFVDGYASVENITQTVSFSIKCLEIRVNSDHSNWIVFNHIALFLIH